MLDQVVPPLALWDARASDDQWNVGSLVVKELLAPCMADPVVGEEDDQGIFEDTFLFEPFHDLTDVPVSDFYRVEVSGPVLQNDRVLRVIGGQVDVFVRCGLHPELLLHSLLQSLITALRCPPQLASMELYLHEKRLTAFAVGPIMAVIHVDVPVEVVVGLAPFVSGGGHAAKIESFESASDAGKVSRFLKKHRDGADSIGQLDTVLAPSAPVVVRADRVLVHARYEGRSKGRANRGGRVSPGEKKTFLRQTVDAGRIDCLFAVA